MFWNAKFSNFSNSIHREELLDVAIIGGGITGLSTAYYLKDSNLKIGLFDKGKLGMGVTSKTTAKITYLQGDIYQRLGKKAKKYYDSQKDAISEIVRIVKQEDISCDLEKVSSILFTIDENNIDKIHKERSLIEEFGCKTFDVVDKRVQSAFSVDDTYVFHPLKFLAGISKTLVDKMSIYEDCLVENIKKCNDWYLLSTKNGCFKARDVIICCHYPFFLYPNYFPLKTYIQREYVNVGKIDVKDVSTNYSAVNIDKELHSIRYYKDYVIYGSNKHHLTNEIDYGRNHRKSIEDFRNYFKVPVLYTWMNQDIISHDLLPFIGRIDNHLFVGCAYRAWGMTNGVLAGKILSDLLLHRKNKYSSLFDPRRASFKLYTNSFLGTFHYMKVYAEALWKKNNPSYIRINGVLYAIYKDKEGEFHKICLLCPHMKCNLVFNSYDETWDCPCHGSRFDLDGNLIEGPAKENLKKGI